MSTTINVCGNGILELYPDLVRHMHKYADSVMLDGRYDGFTFFHIVFNGHIPFHSSFSLTDQHILLKQYGDQSIMVIFDTSSL